jgi:hypothetical protein
MTGNQKDQEKPKEKKFEIWRSGFMAQGMHEPAPAALIRVVTASTFEEACDKAIIEAKWDIALYNKNDGRFSYWGCGLYDNEAEARKGFG